MCVYIYIFIYIYTHKYFMYRAMGATRRSSTIVVLDASLPAGVPWPSFKCSPPPFFFGNNSCTMTHAYVWHDAFMCETCVRMLIPSI